MSSATLIHKRFRYLAKVEKGRMPANSKATGTADYLPYLTMEYLRGEVSEPRLVPLDERSLLANDGDLLLLWDGSNAGEFLRAKQGVTSSTTAKITPRGVHSRYFYWACKSLERILRADLVGMGIPHVNGNILANLSVPLPTSVKVQRAIADYLDDETARIDALVAAKERLLALLAKKRQALITRAVTRGLNPNVSFRGSSVPWLSEVPAHWETWKLGHLSMIGNGSTPKRSNASYWFDGTIPWLNSGVVNQDEILTSDQYVTQIAVQECHLPILPPGTVLIAITGQGKTRGQAVVLSTEATINQHLAFVRPDRKRLDAWFLRWWLFSAYDFLRSVSDDAGGTKGALTCEDIANLRIPLPPLREQEAIVEHITHEIVELERACAVTKRSISLLKERRVALISAAVTGMVDLENST